MKNLVKIILLIFIGFSSSVFSQENKSEIADTINWRKIGEIIINYENDRNDAMVSSLDKFTSLQLVVRKAPVDLEEIVVQYKNGDMQKIVLKETVKSEGFSKVIELNGGERVIAKVTFLSSTIPSIRDTRAVIEVWGKKE